MNYYDYSDYHDIMTNQEYVDYKKMLEHMDLDSAFYHIRNGIVESNFPKITTSFVAIPKGMPEELVEKCQKYNEYVEELHVKYAKSYERANNLAILLVEDYIVKNNYIPFMEPNIEEKLNKDLWDLVMKDYECNDYYTSFTIFKDIINVFKNCLLQEGNNHGN